MNHLIRTWENAQERLPGGPACPEVEQDLDEELADLRGTIDRIVQCARPVWGRGDSGLISALELAQRSANSAHELTQSTPDAQRWAVVTALLNVERGTPINLSTLVDEESP